MTKELSLDFISCLIEWVTDRSCYEEECSAVSLSQVILSTNMRKNADFGVNNF